MTTVSGASRRADARRTCFLAAVGAVLGLAGGGAAWVLLHLIGLITNVALFHQWGWALPSFRNFHPGPILLVEAAAGGLAVSLLALWAPVIRGHGIPEAMEAVLTRQSRIAPRAALAKPVSAAIAIGTGGPFGAEGPIIVTGGALGSLIGQTDPSDAFGTQDPVGVRRRRGHVRDLRCSARRGRARDRAAALRVLAPRLRAARRRLECRRSDARGVVRRRSAVPRPASQLRRPLEPAGVRTGRDRVRAPRGGDLQRPLPRRGRLPAPSHLRVLAPDPRRPRLRVRRPRRAPGTRRRLRRHQRRAGRQTRGRRARRAVDRQAGGVVDRARVRHVGWHPRPDPAHQRGVRQSARRAHQSHRPRPAPLARRSGTGRDGRDVRRRDRARPSPRSCSRSSSPATTTPSCPSCSPRSSPTSSPAQSSTTAS